LYLCSRNFLTGQRFEEKQFMVKKWYFYTSLAIIIAFFSVLNLLIEANQWFLINTGGIRYLYPSLQQDDYNNLNIPLQEIYLLV
jgi:hypothetical protein